MMKNKKVHKNSLYNFLLKNRRGWIRIVEAFLSILLVTMVLVLVVNQQTTRQNDSSPKVYNYEVYILRIIELNDTLRNEIISVSNAVLPSTSDNATFPVNVTNQINLATPGSLVCAAEICSTGDICNFWLRINRDIYAQRIFITSTLQTYSPRQLKLFCWPK
jgi:hypothetical protein